MAKRFVGQVMDKNGKIKDLMEEDERVLNISHLYPNEIEISNLKIFRSLDEIEEDIKKLGIQITTEYDSELDETYYRFYTTDYMSEDSFLIACISFQHNPKLTNFRTEWCSLNQMELFVEFMRALENEK